MANYQFRYVNFSGGVIRTTVMQCASDAEAIHKARHIMKDQYARLEIFEDERAVYSQEPETGLDLALMGVSVCANRPDLDLTAGQSPTILPRRHLAIHAEISAILRKVALSFGHRLALY